MDVLPAFHALKRQYSKLEGWLSRGALFGKQFWGAAASMMLEVGRLLWVVHSEITEVAEECYPVMCNYIVRLHCYLVCNYIGKTPLSRDIFCTNYFKIY